MAKSYKVKYKERNKLASSLKKEIRSKGFNGDGTLVAGIRIAAESGVDLNGVTIRIIAPFYYLFLDLGTGKKAIGSPVKQPPVDGSYPNLITQDWLSRSDTQAIIGEIMQDYFQWRLNEFKIFQNAFEMEKPRVKVGMSLYGDPTGEWNIDIKPQGVKY